MFGSRDLLPRFPVPAGENEESWFRKEVEEGVAAGSATTPATEVRRQVDYEVGVIVQMGFPAYFLVVADLVRYAKENGIRVGPGRGQRAGCTVSYCLGITELDPLKLRTDLRAFPQPGTRVDARHRHGLRRTPARRHDPVRHRALRRGPGRSDHHLRHHQGEAGDQRLGARAGLSLRDG